MEMNSNWQNQGEHEKLLCSPRHVTLQYLYISGIKARASVRRTWFTINVTSLGRQQEILLWCLHSLRTARETAETERQKKAEQKMPYTYLHFSKRHNIYTENIYKSNFSLSLSLVSAAALIVGAHTALTWAPPVICTDKLRWILQSRQAANIVEYLLVSVEWIEKWRFFILLSLAWHAAYCAKETVYLRRGEMCKSLWLFMSLHLRFGQP